MSINKFIDKPSVSGSSFNACTFFRVDGALDPIIKEKLRIGIKLLQQLSFRDDYSAFQLFKNEFKQKYDQRFVPLLQALDPDMGIDYLQLSDKTKLMNRQWSKVHSVLMNKWTALGVCSHAKIELTDEDLLLIGGSTKEPFSPSLMVLFQVLDERVFVIAAGGPSALQMMGRFTKFDADCFALAKSVIHQEEKNNPEVIFAELNHQEELNTENISGQQLRTYQISLMLAHYHIGPYEIALSDLYLGLEKDMLILYSKAHQKRIIPRLSSAYNYQRSDFGPFRLLCDLQKEGLNGQLSFKMEEYFPNLHYYPRVCYQDVILSPAQWHLNSMLFEIVGNSHQRQDHFFKIMKEYQLPVIFVWVQGDQKLVVDTLRQQDVELFLQSMKGVATLIIEEHFVADHPLIKTAEGATYQHELMAIMVQQKAVYQHVERVIVDEQVEDERFKRDFFPMSDWYYLIIELHPSQCNELLLTCIIPFAELLKAKNLILEWHFLRYADPQPQLRFRFRPKILKKAGHVVLQDQFTKLLKQMERYPFVKNVSIAIYKRELERYAILGMAHTEQLFTFSSAYVAKLLGKKEHQEALFTLQLWACFECLGLESTEIGKICFEQYVHMKNLYGLAVDQKIMGLRFRTERVQWQQYRFAHQRIALIQDIYHLALIEKLNKIGLNHKINMLFTFSHLLYNRYFEKDPLREEIFIYYALSQLVKDPRMIGA
ncbi:thiopeptide-type bacteriocin biosynthesis protein [Pedobacter cryophilus]|uniref:Lantibiotic dehydratase n=1 Tax=Pedobacter cryophilus TaxID=2571271 RepID=A0A4U1C3G1_9SPHI|nr:thiopeptide-type bacteriocin biosynthesis protein [Pedobacter cryophilus]TKB98649.1 hypothetical protein FA046_05895 [Pedobacter cryophilus]